MSRRHCNRWTAWITMALIALTIILISAPSSGQSTGIINGTVKDQKGAVEFANVLLTEAADTAKIVGAAATDSLGQFAFNNLSNGEYLLSVRFLGFKTKRVQ